MHFYKMAVLGQDYIFLNEKGSVEKLKKEDIKRLCDRHNGIGADGIFGIVEKCSKNVRIRAFGFDGELLPDCSSAAICASFGLKMSHGVDCMEICCEKSNFFALNCDIGKGISSVSCDIKNSFFEGKNDITERKTELGNRILTLTGVFTSGIYAIHFSSCPENLDRKYLSEKTESHALFDKQAKLVICSEADENHIEMQSVLMHGIEIAPFAGAYCATAIAMVRTGRCKSGAEIKISYGEETAFVYAENRNHAVITCDVKMIYKGEILLDC